MRNNRVSAPDDPTPDTAMASGSDAGGPGGHLGPGDLAPDEERLLAALERDGRAAGPYSPEETAAFVRAAEDEAPLPAEGGVPDDGLTPRFSEPG
ncbi:hypothetical protein [Blastococcus sp. VKM Ac-2987]|uniref:hypothetical protein n=1 Tax=Blastococcus sp. VKM Ac-2987 TaxID=3004141 RepID=UPI0022AB6A38|nr:hypothetical protein [Blastococcus sp. VKM Ac-2987]MCZ2857649.1 hypothetical protein [Blastococcus sp. VKM Ac-2987]